MGGTQRNFLDSNSEARLPALVPATGPAQLILPLRAPSELQGQRLVPAIKPKRVTLVLPGRCAERGCVFPAVDAEGWCVHHQRQLREPGLYSSRQPSLALLAQGKFGPAKSVDKADDTEGRAGDRRRLAAERERFLGE